MQRGRESHSRRSDTGLIGDTDTVSDLPKCSVAQSPISSWIIMRWPVPRDVEGVDILATKVVLHVVDCSLRRERTRATPMTGDRSHG